MLLMQKVWQNEVCKDISERTYEEKGRVLQEFF
jgi:hypothetical protein